MNCAGSGGGKRAPGEFTEKQEAFIAAYVRTRSARQAAREAGLPTDGRSSWQMFHTPKVADEITRRLGELRRRNEHAEDMVVQELSILAFADLTDFVTFDGQTLLVKRLEDIPEEVRPAIKKVTLTPSKNGDRVAVEMHDKVQALEKLGKYLDLWGERLKVENTGQAQTQINVFTGVPRPPDGDPAPEDYSDL